MSEILTRAAVRKMGKAKLVALMNEKGIPFCRDYSVADCRDAVLATLTTEYAIRIGKGYFAGDDCEPVANVSDALTTEDKDAAEREAEMIRQTWEVRPEAVTVVEI